MKTKEELNALKEEVETLNKKLAELTDEEVEKVNGGMKIILTKSPEFISPLLPLIYKTKKPSTGNADTDTVITDSVIADSDDIDLE